MEKKNMSGGFTTFIIRYKDKIPQQLSNIV